MDIDAIEKKIKEINIRFNDLEVNISNTSEGTIRLGSYLISMIFASNISFHEHSSVFWMVIDGFLSWFYLVYLGVIHFL